MTDTEPDVTTTLFILPSDATLLPVSELSARLRGRIGPAEGGRSVLTRPGFRITARLLPDPLATLIEEFREPSLLTDAVLRFARKHDQDPITILDFAFDALATLAEARLLVPYESAEATAVVPSLGAGQEFGGVEIEAMIRSLEDTEVYRGRGVHGESVALKITRDDRPVLLTMLANEAQILEHLGGAVSPRLLGRGVERGRAFVAMEWCEGVSVGIAAQQARAARDRPRLHALVSRMLDAYGRLHAHGVLHGDIHPGNCLVRDDGGVVIIDFGNARRVDGVAASVDLGRAGLPQFFDPLMADATLSGRMPPAATPTSEQFAIATLAYILLTGLHPIDAPALQEELLQRIIERRPLPFPARGIPAWPEVEQVVSRGLANDPGERFGDVGDFARAFAHARLPPVRSRPLPDAAGQAFERAVEAARRLAPSAGPPLQDAWFALRAAVALEDAELLAAADLLTYRLGARCGDWAVVAAVARARSDRARESEAIAGFLTAARRLRDGPEAAVAMLATATVLGGSAVRSSDATEVAGWAAERLDLLPAEPRSSGSVEAGRESLLLRAALQLVSSGVVAVPERLLERLTALEEMQTGGVWLWSSAHEVFGENRFRQLALSAPRPTAPLAQGLALLRLHQLTGDLQWIDEASELLASAPDARLLERDTALLMAELLTPEQATLPPFSVLHSGKTQA